MCPEISMLLCVFVQCRQGVGVCPDDLDSRGTCNDDVKSVSGFNVNRLQQVSFSRPFTTGKIMLLTS